MPPRVCMTLRLLRAGEERDNETDSESESWSETDYDSDESRMRCVSCDEEYDPERAGTCKECYHEANETEDELKREIQELKSKVSFLTLSSPILDPSSTDLVLLPSSHDASLAIPAHKAVLVSRSPVFRAMLENDMEESRSGTIKISDVSYEALCAFVNYLYTAEALLDNQMACDLLVLAEKYEVKHLKAYCEKYLIAKLNSEKAIVNYAFAHQHNAKQLLDAALAVIIDNMENITKNEDYLELVDCNPRLVVEIYESYVSKQDEDNRSMRNGKNNYCARDEPVDGSVAIARLKTGFLKSKLDDILYYYYLHL